MGRKPRGLQPHAWLLTRLFRKILRTSVKWRIANVRAIGLENIPRHGAGIIACNHQSFADPPVIWGSVPRNLVAVAMKELWRTPLAPVMWLLGHIPIDRGNAASAAKTRHRMERVVTNGGLVLIFPEGKMTRTGELLPFKHGATDIAWKTQTAIIPAGIAGASLAWPIGGKIARREPIVVCYGTPLLPADFASSEELMTAMRASIVTLMAQAEAVRAAA